MADAVAVELADAIVTRLNAAAITDAPTFTRAYRVFFERKELSTVQGTVIPSARTVEPAARNANAEEYEFQIGIHKEVNVESTTTEIDALLKMVQLVVDDLSLAVLTTTNLEASPAGIANDPIYDPAKLEEMKVFMSLITVTLRVYR